MPIAVVRHTILAHVRTRLHKRECNPNWTRLLPRIDFAFFPPVLRCFRGSGLSVQHKGFVKFIYSPFVRCLLNIHGRHLLWMISDSLRHCGIMNKVIQNIPRSIQLFHRSPLVVRFWQWFRLAIVSFHKCYIRAFGQKAGLVGFHEHQVWDSPRLIKAKNMAFTFVPNTFFQPLFDAMPFVLWN